MSFVGRLVASQQEGKALGPNRFLDSNAPLATYTPGGGANRRKRALMSQREAKHHLQAFGGDEAIDWVMSATSLYADAAATAPWHLERDGKRVAAERTAETPAGQEIADQRLIELLRKPNPFMDYVELIELLVIDLLLVGNAYWLKYQTVDDKPFAIYRLSPSYVKIQPGPSGIEKYVYQPPGVPEPQDFDPKQIVHFKRPNPHNPYYGLGLIKGGGRPFDLELAMTDAQASYYENKAEPSLIVQSERRVPRDVFSKLTQQLRNRTAGPKKSGELLVLEAGLQAKTLSPSAREAMFAELADKSRDRILGMFHVHPKLIGLPGGADGQDKVADIRREFDNKAARPLMDRLETRITEQLVAAWGYSFHIDYRYSMPQEDAIKLSSEYGGIPGIKVVEVRRFLVEAGLLREESTGDEEIDETVLNLPGAEHDSETGEVDTTDQGSALADNNLSGEAGRPPKPENTRAFPRNGGPLPKGAAVRRPQGKALLSMEELANVLRVEEAKALSFNGDSVRTSTGNKLPGEKRPQDTLAAQRKSDQDALIVEMTRDLEAALHPLERKLLDHVEGKAFSASQTSKKIRNSEAWTTFKSMVEQTMQKYAERGVALAAVQHDNVEEMDYEAIAKEIVYRPDGLRSIVDNFKKRLSAKVQNAEDENSAQQLIRDGIKEYRDGQVRSIAESEVVEAYNEGTLTTFELRGDTDVYVSDGGDDDEPCKEADGSVWTIQHARAHRKEHPRCRRAFVSLAGTI